MASERDFKEGSSSPTSLHSGTDTAAADHSYVPGPPLNILTVDDEPTTNMMLQHILSKQSWSVLTADSVRQANAHLGMMTPDVAIVDVYLGSDNGLQFTRELRGRYPDLGIIVISSEDMESLARKAIESGADYFLSKPLAPAALLLTVRRVVELRTERNRSIELAKELLKRDHESLFPEILAHSDQMRAVFRLIEKVSQRDLTVLIHGESGTGKELVARAIHRTSNRSHGPFVELNCAALPANLVESELFGHERGAFTGAITSRVGKIQQADKGTLFLDEIGELPLEIQPKLLRALQEKRITPVGGKKEIECDFRLVSATHRDLLAEVNAGNFREDLFYRVAVFPVKLPPLRDRMEDFELLLADFLSREGVKRPRITADARDLLRSYHWPGNIRELKNFAQAVTLLSDREIIDAAAIQDYFGSRMGERSTGMLQSGPSSDRPHSSGGSIASPLVPDGNGASGGTRAVRKLEQIEKEEIIYALQFYRGNISDAAEALGMGRATLYKYVKKHSIEVA